MDLELLKRHGIEISPGASCHLPLFFRPPVRVFESNISHETRIDAFSYIGPNSFMHSVDIGRYCSIGDGVSILSSHPLDRITTSPVTYEKVFNFQNQPQNYFFAPYPEKLKRTTIGHDVWIGTGVKIMNGISIGTGAVVGAGSIVTKDVEPYSITAGSPARVIRKRFSQKVIDRLTSLQWWKYSLIGLDLRWDDLDATLDKIEQLIVDGALSEYNPPWIQVK